MYNLQCRCLTNSMTHSTVLPFSLAFKKNPKKSRIDSRFPNAPSLPLILSEERDWIFYICNEFTVKIFDERPPHLNVRGMVVKGRSI